MISDARGKSDASTGNWIVLGLITAAGLISGTSFAGWVFDVPFLKSFGVEGNPVWPLAAIGFMFLSVGFWATVKQKRLAIILIAVPLIITSVTLFQGITGFDLGVDTMLFPDQLARLGADQPGRPSPSTVATFGFIGLALVSATRRNHAFAELANLLASAALCFGLFSIILFLPIGPMRESVQFFGAGLPAGLATVALASALLLWRHEAGWTLLLSANRDSGRSLTGLILPLVIVLPIIPTLIERWGRPAAAVAPAGIGAAAVFCNVVIIGLLLWLAVDRLTRQQTVLQEVTLALDSAAIALTGPGGKITHWSRGCEELYGWTAAEAVGRRKYELLLSRCEQAGSNALPHAIAASQLELVEQRRDGTEISVIERTEIFERSNRPPLVVLKMLDISDRVRAEAELSASEARLAAAAEAHQIGVSQWNVATGRIDWSPGSEHRLGLPPGGLATFDEWFALIDPADAKEVMDTLTVATAHRDEHIGFKYRFHQPNGVIRTIEGSARCFYDRKGDLTTVVGANVDVTEQIEREAALAAREAQLRSVLEAAPSAMVVVDQQGSVVEFSPAAERLWGYAAAEVIGGPVTILVVPEERQRFQAMVDREAPAEEPQLGRRGSAATGLARDGGRLALEVNVGRARTSEGVLVTMFCHDISGQLAGEQRLSELNAELAHISRQSAMGELAADLAHELNQPLSATANFLAAARMLLKRGEDGERVAEMLRMGEEQTLRSGEIIRRLRDFLSKREGEMRAESLEHTVREAVDLVLFGAAQFDIKLIYQLDPAVEQVFADRIQIQQVLVNLLRNAVEVLRSQESAVREIVIASRPTEDGRIEISVADSGPGLPKALTEQLYSRFATTKGGTAMGIGLSISRRIIEAHGGVLVAENRPGGGAMFRFTLPAVEELDELEEREELEQ